MEACEHVGNLLIAAYTGREYAKNGLFENSYMFDRKPKVELKMVNKK